PVRAQTVTVTTGAPSDYIGETNHNQLFGIENFAPLVTNWTPSTLGQTFTVPTGVDHLDAFSFFLFNYEAATHVRMHASIFAWNVALATEGDELWSSDEFFGPAAGLVPYTFAPALVLSPETMYLALITADGWDAPPAFRSDVGHYIANLGMTSEAIL